MLDPKSTGRVDGIVNHTNVNLTQLHGNLHQDDDDFSAASGTPFWYSGLEPHF